MTGCSSMKYVVDSNESLCAGVAVGIDQNWWNARTYFMNDLVDQTIRAVLLFASAGCFRRVSDSSGTQSPNLGVTAVVGDFHLRVYFGAAPPFSNGALVERCGADIECLGATQAFLLPW